MVHFVAAEASGGGKVNIHTNMVGAAQPGAQLTLQCLPNKPIIKYFIGLMLKIVKSMRCLHQLQY